MPYDHILFLARERQQALLAEAAHDRLVQEALRSRHAASSRTRMSRLHDTVSRTGAALGLAWLTGSRAA